MKRRSIVGRLLAAASVAPLAAGAGPPAAAGRVRAPAMPRRIVGISEFLALDPIECFRQAMRLQRSLEDQDEILHWYHFTMVAVPVGSIPRAVVRWEGIEFSRHERIGEHRYRLHGHNLSFPRDLETGRFVDAVRNPVTGRTVAVPPMALTADPGLVRSPAGVISLDRPSAPPRPDYRVLRRENGFVKVDAIRVPPETWPVTFLEMGTEAAPAALFDDLRLSWLPTEVSGAYVFPWPKWMEMADAPGHMFAAWSGCKLRSIDELPKEFRARAERDFPQLLRVDRRAFDRPLPDLHPG
ncbi:MAG: hypothetical protein U1F11_03605 [Steroidobacteraceae bacterium]